MGEAGWARRAIACTSLAGGGVSGFWVLGFRGSGLGAVGIWARSKLPAKDPTRQGPGGVLGRGGQPLPTYSRTSFFSVVSLLSATLLVKVGSLP